MTLPIRNTLLFAWQQYKQQPLVWLKIILAALLVSGVSSFIAQEALKSGASALLWVPLNIADFLVQMIIGLVMIYYAIRLHDGKSALLSDALAPLDLLWKYIVGSITFGIGVIIGLILLIVPGIIFAIAGSLWPYILVEKRLGGWAAIKESLRLTRGNRWRLFLLGIVLTALNIIGLIPLGLGLLITVPISTLAIVHAYRFLDGAVATAEDPSAVEVPRVAAS